MNAPEGKFKSGYPSVPCGVRREIDKRLCRGFTPDELWRIAERHKREALERRENAAALA